MTDNQYGLTGYLKAIHANDPLMLGQDLNKMGLDFTTKKKYLCKTFTGPWNYDQKIPAVDLCSDVAIGYRKVSQIRNKLPDLKMSNFCDEVLFYIFYNFPGDVYQLAAASELIKRNWRFHKIKKVWLLSSFPLDIPGTSNGTSNGDLGECLCIFFEPNHWRKESHTIHLCAKELEMSSDYTAFTGSQQQKTVPPPKPTKNLRDFIGQNTTLPAKDSSTPFVSKTCAPTEMGKFPHSRESTHITCVMEKLKQISQGIAIPRSELKLLINFLSENLEIFGQIELGNCHQFLNYIQYEPEVAGVLLTFQLMYDPASYYGNLEILLNMNMNIQTLMAVNKFIQLCDYKSLNVPCDFLNKFISLCISTCDRDQTQDHQAAHRLVRMVCMFFSALLDFRQIDPTVMRSEIQSFATNYLAIREASQLYQKTLQF